MGWKILHCCIALLLITCIYALSMKRSDVKRTKQQNSFQPLLRTTDRTSARSADNVAPPMHVSVADLGASERLQKVIARAGFSSRRTAEDMILDGRVSVNGNLVTVLGSKINARKDKVSVDGKILKVPDVSETYWVALNKPKSVITTMRDEGNRETVLDLVPKASELRLVPVGGMDRDFTGIMVLTNDVGWIHPLTHPSHPHMNKYEVVISGIPSEADVEKLKKGIVLEGDNRESSLESASIVDVDTRANMCILSVKADERSTNQIERLLETINCPVVGLKRTEYHGLKLKGLKKGQWRELIGPEIQGLKDSCSKEPKSASRQDSDTKISEYTASPVSAGFRSNVRSGAASWAERRSELAHNSASRDGGAYSGASRNNYSTSKRLPHK